MREMFSSISVPPRSLTPQRSASVAASRPIFTQLAWRLGIVRPSARRKAAVCLRFSLAEISSIPCVRPSIVLKGMKLSGTNSVIPPVRSCSARTTRMWRASSRGSSMWPNITVEVERRPAPVRGFDDLHPAPGRQLVGRDPLAHAVVEHLRRGAWRGAEPALDQVLEHLLRRAARALAHVVDLHRRVGVQVQLRRRLLRQSQPPAVLLQGQVRDGCRPACRARSRRTRPPPRPARRSPAR